MSISSTEIQENLASWNYEPTRSISYSIGLQERLFDGEVLFVDPSTPAVQLTEMNVILSHAAIQRSEILDYRSYPNMAQTEEDLKYHKSDRDYIGDFATPGSAWFDIYMAESEILAKAVKVGDTKTRKLTIPKHTSIVYNGMTFTFQYPINFIVKSHGSIDVVYDISRPSPLQQMRGNVVDWDIIKTPLATSTDGMIRQVRLSVNLKQMTLSSTQHSVMDAKILRKTLALVDQFYYMRAFNRVNGTWEEIKTTNSQQMFDPNDPTILYTLGDGEVTFELPYVFSKTAKVLDTVRIDVYTTKGPINLDFDGSTPSQFTMTWNDLDKDSSAIFYAPLKTMNTISAFSTDIASGGTNPPTFEVKRQRVKDNAVGDPVIPISDAQMGTELALLGFDSMLVEDDLSRLSYLTSRPMPENLKGRASTGIDSAILTLKSSMKDLVAFKTVIDNGQHITITPETLYQYTDGVVNIVPDAVRLAIDTTVGDAKVNRINGHNYLYTPLHYVLDIDDEKLAARAYYLSAPKFDISTLNASNDSLGLTIGSSKIKSIRQEVDGYVIDMMAQSNDVWKSLKDTQVHVQLGFIPEGESTYAFINGVLLTVDPDTKERIYRFRIITNWDLSANHTLTTTNFSMFENIPRRYPTALNSDFTLVWAVSDYTVDGAESTTIDQLMGTWLLPDNAIGVYQENLTVELGDELSGLWTRCRGMVGERKYAVYEKDVHDVWLANDYALDENKHPIIIVGPDGSKTLEIAHAKGTVKIGGDGEPVVKHEKGTAIIDENGNHVMESDRNIMRWVDLTLFDASYRYVTDEDDMAYALGVPDILVEWINDTLGGVKKDLLTNSQLLFQPRTTLKLAQTRVEDSEMFTLHTAQRLTIDLYVTNDVYTDSELRTSLKASAIKNVVERLNGSTVARNVLERAVSDNLGTDIIGVHIAGLGGMVNDFNVIVLLDDTTRLCVAKALEVMPNGTYSVVDAIEVNFKLNDARGTA